jgi:hypothetical protein
MIRTAFQERMRNLLDQHAPMSPEDIAQINTPGPLEPQATPRHPVKRVPYDSLYLKRKANRDYWT